MSTRNLALAVCFAFLPGSLFAAELDVPEGFRALFNGENLEGWHGMPHFDPRKLAAMSEEERQAKIERETAVAREHWTVENGELVNDGKGPYLTTNEEFGDIELRIDYKTVPRADSGIYLRGTPQIQIWDWTKEGGKWNIGADKGSGGLWNNSQGAPGKDPRVLADKPFGQWNRFRIIQVGDRTTVYLNGELVVDHAPMENYWDRKSPLPRKGPIQLQTHGGEIRWRNIFVKELSPLEANAYLRSKVGEGFERIFNGEDLTGWAGATKGYQVIDGALMCRPRSGGVVYHDEVVDDFRVHFEFQLPPGGNNGLAIRYPGGDGHADTAYAGMCELQILDPTGYEGLKDYQYHGSAYGMVPARRGYLRTPGEWNFQLVTVKGSKIKVELNGYTILDTDLSKIDETIDGKKHAKDRKSGYFGFAGHGSPVKFRKVYLKDL